MWVLYGDRISQLSDLNLATTRNASEDKLSLSFRVLLMVIENLYSSTTTYTHQRSSRSGTMMSMPACADYKKALDKFFAIASLITSVLPISSHSSLSPHSPSHPLYLHSCFLRPLSPSPLLSYFLFRSHLDHY